MKVETPLTAQTNIATKFNDMIYTGLPINKWCKEQEEKNKKIKL